MSTSHLKVVNNLKTDNSLRKTVKNNLLRHKKSQPRQLKQSKHQSYIYKIE